MRALFTMGMMVVTAAAVVIAQGPPSAAPAVPTVVKVGDMAPDFSLQGTDGKTHKLSEYRGKSAVVVAWFPKAFTQGCTIECKSLAENGDKIRTHNVAYFMASVDPLEDNIKFAKATSVTLGTGANARTVEKKEADFPMLSDPTKATAKAFATENAQTVVDDAVQILGGRGVLKESMVDLLYRSVRALRIYEGTTEIQHLLVAAQILKAAKS